MPEVERVFMVNRNLIRTLEDDDIAQELDSMFAEDVDLGDIIFPETDVEENKFELNEIIEGKIVRVDDDFVVIDVGFKK